MTQPKPQSRVEIAFSSTVPLSTREPILAGLRANGVEPILKDLKYSSVEVDPLVIAFSVVITYLVKPTAEAIGVQIRDGLSLAASTLKNRLGLGGTYIVTIEVDDRRVRYWVPVNESEDDAWSAMFVDFDRRPDIDRDRRWWPGKGWLTDPEI